MHMQKSPASVPSSCAINRIPTELFQVILSAIGDTAGDPHTKQQTYLSCILVCKSWYHVALPFLWRNPHLPTPARVLNFIFRHLHHAPTSSPSPRLLIRRLDLSARLFSEPADTSLLHVIASATPNLTALKIFADPLDPRTLQSFFLACPLLTDLTITGSFGSTTARSRFFHHNLPPLRSMDLSYLLNFGIPRLRALHMGSVDCPPIDGLAFAWMVATSVSQNLKEFSLGIVTSPTRYTVTSPTDDGVLIEIARRCPNLQVLSAQGRFVTDGSLAVLGALCPQLRVVDFRNCSGITRGGVMALLIGCPHLRQINIKGTVANDDGMRLAIASAAYGRGYHAAVAAGIAPAADGGGAATEGLVY